MKWIIALLVAAAMFYAGYHHASRYDTDETEQTEQESAGGAAGAANSSAPAS